ncbi:DNA-deoxyinosine glycosylase [Duganella sp. BuS-21]|uniref:DNA-deoxyinosine glycosylase n=1 Tax=Duganella sp. BuS-21 TaxID=2943848 RepID=UPI0035A5CB73
MPLVNDSQAVRKRCFDPVVDERTRLLVLGSLPGDKSLAVQEYYGNRQNRFWSLIAEVIGVELIPLSYQGRLEALLRHGIGLWDVVAEAHRSGSLDSYIRDRQENDLVGLLKRFPQIHTLAFNGGTAARFGIKKLGEHSSAYRIVHLPSSSPAYTLPFVEKLSQWKVLRDTLP